MRRPRWKSLRCVITGWILITRRALPTALSPHLSFFLARLPTRYVLYDPLLSKRCSPMQPQVRLDYRPFRPDWEKPLLAFRRSPIFQAKIRGNGTGRSRAGARFARNNQDFSWRIMRTLDARARRWFNAFAAEGGSRTFLWLFFHLETTETRMAQVYRFSRLMSLLCRS